MISKERREAHHCHARGCAVHTRPEMLMCFRHWRMVPIRIQRLVYATYRAGQCDDMRPSKAWHNAADAAIGFVAALEGKDLSMAEARALIGEGYEAQLVAIWARKGPKLKAACEKVIAKIKAEKSG
jgi:hypothetical protein